MTIKEFRNLKGNEIVTFNGNTCDEPVATLYRIKCITKICHHEPKFTVREFLSMTEQEIVELKNWESEVADGYIKLCDYNTGTEVHPVIRRPVMYRARSGYSYKCLKIVKD